MARPADGSERADEASSQVLLICGATGTLGQAFARACDARGIRHLVTERSTLDLESCDTIDATLDRVWPWAVVNATGWVRVDKAEAEANACHRINAQGAIALARACAARGIGSVGFSSDLVFDGRSSRPYIESDRPNPLNTYGRSKAAMESGCADLVGALIVRTAAFFGLDDANTFAAAVADALERGERFAAAQDHIVTPTFVPALVDATLDLLIDGADGIWHLAGDESLSWAAFARRVADACGYDLDAIDPVAGESLGWRAPRPRFAALASERGGPVGLLAADVAQFARGRLPVALLPGAEGRVMEARSR